MSLIVKITPNDKANPPGKLADAELHFTDGELDGLKLIGFSIWERRTGGGRNVTFPARQYAVNGERRSFALLRPMPTWRTGAHPRSRAAGLRRARAERRGSHAVAAASRGCPFGGTRDRVSNRSSGGSSCELRSRVSKVPRSGCIDRHRVRC